MRQETGNKVYETREDKSQETRDGRQEKVARDMRQETGDWRQDKRQELRDRRRYTGDVRQDT